MYTHKKKCILKAGILLPLIPLSISAYNVCYYGNKQIGKICSLTSAVLLQYALWLVLVKMWKLSLKWKVCVIYARITHTHTHTHTQMKHKTNMRVLFFCLRDM